MAEENQSQERTEEATPRKRDKAKEEGQVPRSRELTTVSLVTVGAVGLIILLPSASNSLVELARWMFVAAAEPEFNSDQIFIRVMKTAGTALIPFLVLTAFASVAGTLLVGGWLVSIKALSFKASRMSPMKGFKRMFSTKSLVELFKAIGKIFVIATVAILAFTQSMEHLSGLTMQAPNDAISSGVNILGIVFLLLGLSLVVIAALDVPFQIAQHTKQLRMTKQEVKDEMKDSEGKPEVRSRVRRLQQEIAQRRSLQDVPEADVIVTNPDHYSIAIRYKDGMSAPTILAKGVDHMALRIRDIGDKNSVPMVRVPVLARALYFTTEIGDQIPAALYVAVAQVLAYIFQLQQYRSGMAANVPTLGKVEIPEEYHTPGVS